MRSFAGTRRRDAPAGAKARRPLAEKPKGEIGGFFGKNEKKACIFKCAVLIYMSA